MMINCKKAAELCNYFLEFALKKKQRLDSQARRLLIKKGEKTLGYRQSKMISLIDRREIMEKVDEFKKKTDT